MLTGGSRGRHIGYPFLKVGTQPHAHTQHTVHTMFFIMEMKQRNFPVSLAMFKEHKMSYN